MSHYNARVSVDQQYQLIMECRNTEAMKEMILREINRIREGLLG